MDICISFQQIEWTYFEGVISLLTYILYRKKIAIATSAF